MSAENRKLGFESLKAGRFAEAAKHLSRCVLDSPNDDDARLALALTLSGAGEHKKALILIDRLLATAPGSPRYLWRKAQMLERAALPADAVATLKLVLQVDPNHEKARQLLAKLSTPEPGGFEVIEDEDVPIASEAKAQTRALTTKKQVVANRAEALALNPNDNNNSTFVEAIDNGRLVLSRDMQFDAVSISLFAVPIIGGLVLWIFVANWHLPFSGLSKSELTKDARFWGFVLFATGAWILVQQLIKGYRAEFDLNAGKVRVVRSLGFARKAFALSKCGEVGLAFIKPSRNYFTRRRPITDQNAKLLLIGNSGSVLLELGEGLTQHRETEILFRIAFHLRDHFGIKLTGEGKLFVPHPLIRALYDHTLQGGPLPDYGQIDETLAREKYRIPNWAWWPIGAAAVFLVIDLLWLPPMAAVIVAVMQLMMAVAIAFLYKQYEKGTPKDEHVFFFQSQTGQMVLMVVFGLIYLGAPLMGYGIKQEREQRQGSTSSTTITRQTSSSLSPERMKKLEDDSIDSSIADLKNPIDALRNGALMSLASKTPNHRRAEVVALVMPFLKSSDRFACNHAINVLQTWGDKTCLPALRELLNDPDTFIRDDAKRAIEAIEKRQ